MCQNPRVQDYAADQWLSKVINPEVTLATAPVFWGTQPAVHQELCLQEVFWIVLKVVP